MWVSHSVEGTNSGQLRPQLLPRRPRREAEPLPAPSSSQTTPLRVRLVPTTPCRARGQPGHPAQQRRRDLAGRLRLRQTPNRRVESAPGRGGARAGGSDWSLGPVGVENSLPAGPANSGRGAVGAGEGAPRAVRLKLPAF